MILAQITDCHIAPADHILTTRYRTSDYLADAITHIETLDPKPDAIIATGDLVESGSREEYERFRELLKHSSLPVYLMVGNHDSREGLRSVFTDHGYLPEDGYIQYAVDLGPVRMLVTDTLVDGQSDGRLCGDRLAWLESQLDGAPDIPTIIAMHHPPFVTGIRKMDSMGLDGSDGLKQLVTRFDNVERIICGHLHRPITRRFANTVVSTCPGTAHQIQLDIRDGLGLGVIMEPPAVYLHAWIEDEGLVTHTSYVGDHGTADVIYDVNGDRAV